MSPSMLPAALAVTVGVVGLGLCAALMSQSMPGSFRRWWPRRTERGTTRPARRRVVTGASAADRLGIEARPARHPALRPDVLRRERERLSAMESRRIIEQMADHEPERLAGLVGALLAADDRDEHRGAGRKGRR